MEDHESGIVGIVNFFCMLLSCPSLRGSAVHQVTQRTDDEKEPRGGGGGGLPYKNDGGARWKL